MDSLNKDREGLKILLIQIREDPTVREEEHQSFADYSGVDRSQIEVLSVFEKPIFSKEVLKGIDAVFIGGASEASVLEPEKYGFISSCIELIKDLIDQKIPTFASCFGFQLAVLALGGEIIRDTDNFEMGTLPISLTDRAKTDPLFSNTPSGFRAVSVHQEKAIKLPSGCELLAYTDECLHSFKVENAPFWTFQFHPELDRTRLMQRLSVYKEKYTEDPAHLNNILDSIQETPESNLLVKNFVDNILLGK